MSSTLALVVIALVVYCGRTHVGRNIWLVFALRDTLKALKCSYPNGRRIGMLTRRRRIRQCLAGWVVYVGLIITMNSANHKVLAQPINAAADAVLYWFPFYSSLKMVIILGFTYWRSEAAALIFQSLISPTLSRYEEQIDLTLLLVTATARFGLHFLVEVPWAALMSCTLRSASDRTETISVTKAFNATRPDARKSPTSKQSTADPPAKHHIEDDMPPSQASRKPKRGAEGSMTARARAKQPPTKTKVSSGNSAPAISRDAAGKRHPVRENHSSAVRIASHGDQVKTAVTLPPDPPHGPVRATSHSLNSTSKDAVTSRNAKYGPHRHAGGKKTVKDSATTRVRVIKEPLQRSNGALVGRSAGGPERGLKRPREDIDDRAQHHTDRPHANGARRTTRLPRSAAETVVQKDVPTAPLRKRRKTSSPSPEKVSATHSAAPTQQSVRSSERLKRARRTE